MKNKLWGGRFSQKTDPFFEKFSSSIETDHRLLQCDLIGSFIHVHVLKEARLLSAAEFRALKKGLGSLLDQAERGSFPYDFASEDIHTNIQNALGRRAGAAAAKLQTCRSRNDQVVFATKLYCLFSGARLQELIFHLRKGLLELGRLHETLVMPGYTHLQHAQPVYFRDFCRAYFSMFERDAQRLEDALRRLNPSQGAGALAGTPIHAAAYKKAYGRALTALKMPGLSKLIGVCRDSLSTVSDRDFVLELLSFAAILGMHVSRLCEDLILWSTREFGFVELPDAYCTGSSLMPQKKNPDALELMRGQAGSLVGNLVAVLTTLKGLPLSYNRDMQHDKAPLFASLECIEDQLVILTGLLKGLKIRKDSVRAQASDEALCATDLADYLVSRGVAFQEAHEIVGRLFRWSFDKGKSLRTLSQEELNTFSRKLDKKEVIRRLDPVFCAAAKRSVAKD